MGDQDLSPWFLSSDEGGRGPRLLLYSGGWVSGPGAQGHLRAVETSQAG